MPFDGTKQETVAGKMRALFRAAKAVKGVVGKRVTYQQPHGRSTQATPA